MKMSNVDRAQVRRLFERETERFVRDHPTSAKLFERAKDHLLAGVPMNWMVRWAGPSPIFVREGRRASVTDVDGHTYLDLCLGDTGSMFGHSPTTVVGVAARQLRRGITFMLPTEDSVWVGEALARRFGLPYWQGARTGADAHRFSISVSRPNPG